jgi:hypothetical protein
MKPISNLAFLELELKKRMFLLVTFLKLWFTHIYFLLRGCAYATPSSLYRAGQESVYHASS